MTENRGCPECGASVPPHSPAGLCPRCLMGAAFSATGTYKPPARGPGAATPAGPPVDLAEFRRVLLDLDLIAPDELEGFVEGAAGEASRLARTLVRAGKLTAYQAGAIAQGKGKGLAIGSYLVLEKRGQGGMGVVFKARHRDSGRVVALKILLPSFGRDGEAVTRFRREFELAARLGHPNVVAALEASEDRGVQFLTMEYVEGHDLDEMVREVGPLPIKMSLHCVLQAARGLAAAHARGIVHRDVKPGNLMLDPTGAVRVLDLGLARVIEASNPLARAAGASLTQTGVYMGTVDFIAPEQAEDSKKAAAPADIYSLGCTLYFLLTGRPPFEGDTVLQRLMAHQQRPAPSLHAARDDVPAALEGAYQTMMAKRAADRPRSMAEVIGLLEACRTSADEAKQARAGLRGFAETVMKRASPRRRDRSPDASVFARRPAPTGLQFDPDLDLEDLVMDYRDEVPAAELAEDQLPPALPRIAPSRRRRRRSPARFGPVAALALGVAVAAGVYLKFSRKGPGPGTADSGGRVEVAARVDGAPLARSIAGAAGMTLNLIPAGEFAMGVSDGHLAAFLKQFPNYAADTFDDARPSRPVRIARPFYMATTEVTVGQFRRFVEATGYRTETERDGQGGVGWDELGRNAVHGIQFTWRNPGFAQADDHPVVNVTWNDAAAFAAWLARSERRGYRLPTEAEWEYACRAGTDTLFPGGDAYGSLAASGFIDRAKTLGYSHATSPVARFRANAFGLHDMIGNAWEWTGLGDGPTPIPGPAEILAGPADDRVRIRRGGCFQSNPHCYVPAFRSRQPPEHRYNDVGFRVACDAPGGGPAPAPGPAQPSAGFTRLFNGRDLAGWAGDVGGYEVRDGVLRARTRERATIRVRRDYRDFVARVEFRLLPGGNNGLAIRYPGSGDPAFDGMCEIQILDDSAPGFAGIDPRQAHGSAFGMVAARKGALRPVGEWNSQDVTVRGSTVRVELNGSVILDADLARVDAFLNGQDHPGKGRDSGDFGLTNVGEPVEFRRVEVRELPRVEPPADLAKLPPLERPVTLDFRRTPFTEAISFFKRASKAPDLPTGLPLFVDPAGLRRAGRSPTSPITFAAKDVPLGVGLRSALRTIGLDYTSNEGMITVTSLAPADAARFDGRAFKVMSARLSWHQAAQACRDLGGHLAIPTSEGECRFLSDLTAKEGLDSAWLGATDEKVEGAWAWVDGTPLGFTFWDRMQPNNKFGAEHFLILMVAGRGKWSDQPDTPLPASGKWGFVCQWD